MPAKKKQLKVSEEEFFLLCVLEYGRPKSPDRYYPWMRFKRYSMADVGNLRPFRELVMRMGEAGRRAWELYKRYYIWYMKQENKRAREEKAAQSSS